MIASYWGALRSFHRDVRLYLGASALNGLVSNGIRAVLGNLYLLRLGYGPEEIGLFTAVGLVVFTLACLPAGALGRRWSASRALTAGTALLVASIGLVPLVELVPRTWWIAWLVGANVINGLGLALYHVSGMPFLMAATGSEERDHAFSLNASLEPLASFLGSLLGGVLPGLLAALLAVSAEGAEAYRYSLAIAALLLVPAVLLLRAAGEVGAGPPERRAAAVRRAPYGLIAMLALVVVFRYAGKGTVDTFYNVYLDAGLGLSTTLIGVLIAVGKLSAASAALATPLLTARWGRSRVIVVATLAIGLLILPLALLPHWAAAGLGFVGLSAFSSIAITAMRVYSQEAVSPAWRFAMSGALVMGAGLSASAMAFGGGYLIPSIGYSGLFLAGAGLTVAGAALFWGYFRVPRGELAGAPDAQ